MTDHERAVAYWRAFKAALPPTTVEAIAAEVGKRLGVKLAYATTENAIRRVIDPDDPTAKDRPNQKVPASELDAVLREVLPAPPLHVVTGNWGPVRHERKKAHAAGLAALAAISREGVRNE